MFEGYAVYVTKNIKPPPKELKPIIEIGGGTYCTLAQIKRIASGEKKICLTCDKDIAGLEKDASMFDGIYTNEFVLSGLLQQQFDLKKYAAKGISAGGSSSSSSSSSSKKKRKGATTKAASTRTSKRARK